MANLVYGMANSFNAGKTAVDILRSSRRNDQATVNNLTTGLDATEQAALAGALAALANAALNCLDDVCAYARSHGVPELSQSSDDVLAVMAIGLE
jgi:hypothetical protein